MSAMNLKRDFNRIGHLFNDGVETTRKQTADWVQTGSDRASRLARRVRGRVDSGARNAVTIEESIVSHIRENPALYILGGALLITILIAKLLREARQSRNAPLL